MRLVLLAVGRLKTGPERELVARYADRVSALSRTAGIARLDLLEVPEGEGSHPAERQRTEAERLLARAGDGPLVAFDERGESPTSTAFADTVRGWRDEGRASVAFVIGGPDGLAASVRERADRVVAFGRLTVPHGLVRVLAAEQIYRALTVMTGHPYHRGG